MLDNSTVSLCRTVGNPLGVMLGITIGHALVSLSCKKKQSTLRETDIIYTGSFHNHITSVDFKKQKLGPSLDYHRTSSLTMTLVSKTVTCLS